MLRVSRDRGRQNQEQLDELLSAFIDGMLDADERKRLEGRLEREPALRQRLEELRLTVRALNNLPPVEVPRNFILSPAMVAAPKPRPRPRRRQTWPLFGWATAVAMLLLLLVLGGDIFVVRPAERREPADVVALAPLPPATEAPMALMEAPVAETVEEKAALASPTAEVQAERAAPTAAATPTRQSAADAAQLPREFAEGAVAASTALTLPVTVEAEGVGTPAPTTPLQTFTETVAPPAGPPVGGESEAVTATLPAVTPLGVAVAERTVEDEAAPMPAEEETEGVAPWLRLLEVLLGALVVGLATATLVIRWREGRRAPS